WAQQTQLLAVMWRTASSSTQLLLGAAAAVILACSHLVAANHEDWEDLVRSPASDVLRYPSGYDCGSEYKCPSSKFCSKKGGECKYAGTCSTNVISGTCSGKEGDSCSCCAKMLPKCRASNKCTENKGFCVKKAKACAGGKLLKGQCKCKSKGKKGKKGHCCVPKAPVCNSHWGYSFPCGPESWEGMYSTCGGNLQSPIDILASEVAYTAYSDPWVFTGYDSPPSDITLKNNGHSVSITWNGVSDARVTGGHLGSEYTLSGFHFHWGSLDCRGSEHLIDGRRYPLEMHLVHYKSAYGNISNAINYSDGLAVLGVLFHRNDPKYPGDNGENPIFSAITDALSSVTDTDEETTVSFSKSLSSLLPYEKSYFARYSGSLTTPTCNEVVTWTVFTTTVGIGYEQLDAFRALKLEDGSAMVDNFRPPQPTNSRKIDYFYIPSITTPWQ
ncbi:unnamed protein product, partial [Meganyctiphanes norvegica]